MKVPRTFIPEKGLENKLEQLIEEPKTYKKEAETQVCNAELEDLLKEFNLPWIGYESVYSKAEKLLTKTGYTQIRNKKFKYEYWTKPVSFGENYILTIFGEKYNQHYAFSRIKDGNVEKFCKKFEYQRKMVYPKSFLLTGLAISGSLAASYMCSSYPQGSFFKDMLSWMIPGLVVVPTILSILSIVKYVRNRVGKGLDKYCVGLIINDDNKALEAAFS